MDEVVLRLDEKMARDLYDVLCAVAELRASGAPLPTPPPDALTSLNVVFRDLETQLGLESLESAMARALRERKAH